MVDIVGVRQYSSHCPRDSNSRTTVMCFNILRTVHRVQCHTFIYQLSCSARCFGVFGEPKRVGAVTDIKVKEHSELAVADSRQGVVLQLGDLARCSELLTVKN